MTQVARDRRVGTLRGTPPKMMFPRVSDLAADRISVAVNCRVLGFSKQGYYACARNR
jgi:hypothetical protein